MKADRRPSSSDARSTRRHAAGGHPRPAGRHLLAHGLRYGLPGFEQVAEVEDLGLTRMFECNVNEKRHDARAECLQLLLRIPHFAH
jgi:hypothetical protein